MKNLKMNFIQCLCLLFIVGNSACSKGIASEAEVKAVNVKTIQVSTSKEAYEKEYIGSIESENTVDLSFQVNGNVNQVFVQEGQSVRKGQLLASLDQTSLQNVYVSAKASLMQAEDALKRQTMLYENNSLPEIQYVEIKTKLEQAQATEQIAKKNLGDCNLYAPFSGVIGTKSIDVGTNVMPGVQVMTLMNIEAVKVKIAIPENHISAIQLKDYCKVKITAMNNQEFEGQVVEKGVVSHPISHTYDIKVKLDNRDNRIMPGMVCKAYLNSNHGQGILIPLKAIQVDFSNKNYVWIINSENKAERKPVTTSDLIGNYVLVENGLHDGDNVVIEGYQNLSPSAYVRVN